MLTILALWPLGAPANAVPLPFTVDNSDGYFEVIIAPLGGKVRLVVLHAPKTDDQPDALKAFAPRVKDFFVAFQVIPLWEKDALEIGYHGRELRFDLVSEKEAFACELFAFADDQMWWGVMYVTSREAFSPTLSPFRILHKKVALPSDVVGLAPFRVKENAITGFAINLRFVADQSTGRVAKIMVSEVPPGSEAERAGVLSGDEIVAINRRKTQDYVLGLSKESELGLIFLNRNPGDEVELELMPSHATKSRFIVLQIPRGSPAFRR
ncbi:MAG: hypothetical protein EXS39_02495 [Opitutaceae bacterium]|nr:hypothetical protein [Opitutaceae bacterium]